MLRFASARVSLLFLFVLYIQLTIHEVIREIHSLKYMYTAFSKPLGPEGLHEFTAIGLLDGTVIDYYDSDNPTTVSKQRWMKGDLKQNYLEQRTKYYNDEQEWLKSHLQILMTRMNQDDKNVHVLQWLQGCERETQPDGSLKLMRAINKYAYDGEDFLYYDFSNSVWVAADSIAEQLKNEWNERQILKGDTEECMDWLDKFLKSDKEQPNNNAPPEVFVFAKDTKIETNILLTCLATGFYPKDIIVNIKRNERILTEIDGVDSSKVRPNEDGTYQVRKSVEILKTDLSKFTCHIIHKATGVDIHKDWDHKVPREGNTPAIIGAVGGVVVLGVVGAVAGLLVYLKRRQTPSKQSPTVYSVVTQPGSGSNGSVSSSSSGSETNSSDPPSDGTQSPLLQ